MFRRAYKRVLVGVVLCWLLIPAAPSLAQDVTQQLGKPLDGQLAPEFLVPERMIWGAFQSAQGPHTLRYGHLPTSGQKRGIIVIQGGMTEFAEKYVHTMRPMADWGYDVWTMDWRGHGKSSRYYTDAPQRLGAQGYDRDAADLVQLVTDVIQPPDAMPVYLIAHSMGAQISLRVLHDAPEVFDKAVLSAPMFDINTGGIPQWLVYTVASLMDSIGLGHVYLPGQADFDPATATYSLAQSQSSQHPVRYVMHQDWYLVDPELVIGGPTWRWMNVASDAIAQTYRADYMAAIQTPLLLGSGGRDGFVDHTSHDQPCLEWLPACTLHKEMDAKHEFFQELDIYRDPWMAKIKNFLAQ